MPPWPRCSRSATGSAMPGSPAQPGGPHPGWRRAAGTDPRPSTPSPPSTWDLDRWARPGQVVEVHASAAECWARLGDEDRSAGDLERAREAATELGYEGPWALAAARHAALFGDPTDAIDQLDRLAPEGTEGVIPMSEPGRQMLRALAE